MSAFTRMELGKYAEEIALDYLLQSGLKLLEKNWRCRHLEIDLIMEGVGAVHIVEVRSLKYPALVDPEDTVVKKKQRFLIKAASSYVNMKHIDKEISFDIISIIFKSDKYEIKYIPNAFLPFC